MCTLQDNLNWNTMPSPKELKFLSGLKAEILEFFELNDYRSYSLNQLHKAFAIRDRKTKEIYSDLVAKLIAENRLIKNEEGNVRFDNESFQVTGRVCDSGRWGEGYLGGISGFK